MWINPGNTSCSRRKRAIASSPLKMKSCGSSHKGDHQNELPSPRPRASTRQEATCRKEFRKTGPICKSRKRDDHVMIPSNRLSMDEEIDDLDIKQFGKGQVFDDKDSMWLSSDRYSASSFFEDYRLSGSLRASVDDWLVSWLSTLASSYLNIDKGSAVTEKVQLNPEDTEPLTPELQQVRNFEVDSSVASSDVEESASCSLTSSASASPYASSSEAAGFDIGASLLVSLVDLDHDDHERVSSEPLVDHLSCFPSGFRSPSCGTTIWSSSEAGSSSSCYVSTTTSEWKPEGRNQSSYSPSPMASGLEDLDSDEPIFWPLDRKLEWSSEKTWTRFSMSPRRDTIAIRPRISRSTPAKPRLPLSMSWVAKFDARESCRRQLVWDSNSAASEILQSRRRNNRPNNGGKRADHPTLRRPRNPVMGPTKMVPKGVKGGMVEDTMRGIKEARLVAPSGKHPIEVLLGLGEFDGHEGVGSDFNCDVFDLD